MGTLPQTRSSQNPSTTPDSLCSLWPRYSLTKFLGLDVPTCKTTTTFCRLSPPAQAAELQSPPCRWPPATQATEQASLIRVLAIK